MTLLTKEDLETKSIGELFKARDDNFITYVKEHDEIKAKYEALLTAELEALKTKYYANGKLILDTFHQKTNTFNK